MFKYLAWGFLVIIPGILWDRRIQRVEGVGVKNISEIVDLSRSPGIASFLLVIIHDFIEIATYKPTNFRVRMGRCDLINQTPRKVSGVMICIAIKAHKIKWF